MRNGARLVLRADAVFDAGMGALLLSASWDGLYDALELPRAEPALYAQVAGGLLLGYAYLLWAAPGKPLQRPVAGATAAVNSLGVLVIGAWLLSGNLDAGALGQAILWLAVAALVVFAAGEAAIGRRESA